MRILLTALLVLGNTGTWAAEPPLPRPVAAPPVAAPLNAAPVNAAPVNAASAAEAAYDDILARSRIAEIGTPPPGWVKEPTVSFTPPAAPAGVSKPSSGAARNARWAAARSREQAKARERAVQAEHSVIPAAPSPATSDQATVDPAAPDRARPDLATNDATTSLAVPAPSAPSITPPAVVDRPLDRSPERRAPSPAQANAEAPAATEAELHMPAGPEVGVAAFRRGDIGVIVFDERIPLAPEQRAALDGFDADLVPQAGRATILIMSAPPGQALVVAREPDGWRITRGPLEAPIIGEAPVASGLGLTMDRPGRSLVIQDPLTDGVLLVGTSKQTSGIGPMIAAARAAPGYTLLPTWLGVACEPSSDVVELHVVARGFTLVTPDLNAPARAVAAAPQTRFGLSSDPAPVLVQRLRAQIASAAAQPPRARGPDRLAAARTMLSLGLGLEAHALLTLAIEDDPATAKDPIALGLAGVAGVLAGRFNDAAGLDDPRLNGTEEIALWRSLRDAGQGKPAPALASYMDAARAYPAALQRQVLQPVVEAAIDAGKPVAFETLSPDSPVLAFARALYKQRAGDITGALASLDALARGENRLDAVRAAIRAAEIRLAGGQIAPAAAADILERQTVAWRGDGRELTARLRVAELRTLGGAWQKALEWLRDTDRLFPAAKSDTALRKAEVFKALLAAPADRVQPMELVTIAGDFADCIPDGEPGSALAGLLADKLLALDLPDRAGPVLQKLMEKAGPGQVRSQFGSRLAQLLLETGEPAKAEATLRASDAPDLAPDSRDGRAILLARARADQGDVQAAVRLLATLPSPAAGELRASLLAKAQDWRGSLEALRAVAAQTIPSTGELSSVQQDLMLRQATAAVQAGNPAVLNELRAIEARMTPPRADLFRVLTAPSLRSTEDLPRSARELAMNRSFPERLDALMRR
ncbi:MAG: hypothetical protein NVSMB18_20750 [Acetobacteraceae bacterium]